MILTGLKETILQYNPYFNKGFDNVYGSAEGIYQSNTEQLVFPNDTLGDYFYIRIPQPISATNIQQTKITDCHSQYAVNTPVVLVAIVRKADRMKLINNLLNTIAAAGGTIRNFTSQPETVIINELNGMGADIIERTIANTDKTTAYIAISFDYYVDLPVIDINCLPNPCEVCSG